MIISCINRNVQENFILPGFSKSDISVNWSVQLPIGSKIRLLNSNSLRTTEVTFPNDSLFINCYYWVENSNSETDCSFSARVKRMESGGCDEICQGDGSLYINYIPIVNYATEVTGCRGDWKSNNRRFVIYLVYDCKTGEYLMINFEGVSDLNYQLIEKIIMSVEFQN